MTNGWIDIKNTDMMLIMGGNPAENHPCGFKWAVEAKRNRDAKMIVVDPRFTRTASQADLFCQIRAGSDIAFLGGVINYALAEQSCRARVPGQLHQRRLHHQGRIQASGRRPVLRLRSRRRRPTTRPPGITRRAATRPAKLVPPSGSGDAGRSEGHERRRDRRRQHGSASDRRKVRAIRRRARQAQRAWAAARFRRRRCRRMSPTTCRCRIRAASTNF